MATVLCSMDNNTALQPTGKNQQLKAKKSTALKMANMLYQIQNTKQTMLTNSARFFPACGAKPIQNTRKLTLNGEK